MKLETDWPDALGVMNLPGVQLFPGSLVPLYIFEHRYRKMLADALATQRIFGIVSSPEAGEDAPRIAGAGLIRACVGNDDGTSHLILLGLCRILIREWVTDREYPAVKAAVQESRLTAPEDAGHLQREIKRLCRSLAKKGRAMPPHFEDAVSMAADPAELSDLVASTLVEDSLVREHLFYELDASRRLEMLADYLSTENLGD